MIQLILENRTMCLLPFVDEIATALANHSKVSKDDQKEMYQLSDGELQLALATVATWHDLAWKAGKALYTSLDRSQPIKASVTQHFLPQCPVDLYKGTKDHPFHTKENFLLALHNTHLNFLVSPTNTTNGPYRTRMLSALYLETMIMKLDIYPMIKNNAVELHLLREQIEQRIQTVPGLATFKLWYKVKSDDLPSEESVPSLDRLVFKDEHVSEAEIELQVQGYTSATKSTFQQLFKGLNKPGVAGVPCKNKKDGCGLHPAVADALAKFHEVRFRLNLFHRL